MMQNQGYYQQQQQPQQQQQDPVTQAIHDNADGKLQTRKRKIEIPCTGK